SLMMLASIYEKNEKTQYAGIFYSRLVSQYPLSPYVDEAKQHLTKLGLPIPAADPNALARMQKEQQTPHPHPSLVAKAVGPFENRPSMANAARSGTPQMNPPDEATDLDTMMRSSGFNINASGSVGSASSGSGGGGTTGTGSTTGSTGATDGGGTTGA